MLGSPLMTLVKINLIRQLSINMQTIWVEIYVHRRTLNQRPTPSGQVHFPQKKLSTIIVNPVRWISKFKYLHWTSILHHANPYQDWLFHLSTPKRKIAMVVSWIMCGEWIDIKPHYQHIKHAIKTLVKRTCFVKSNIKATGPQSSTISARKTMVENANIKIIFTNWRRNQKRKAQSTVKYYIRPIEYDWTLIYYHEYGDPQVIVPVIMPKVFGNGRDA